MDALRRTLLKGAGATGVLTAAIAAGLLKPSQVLAAEINRLAFDAKDVAGALKAAGAGNAAESKDIVIRAPDIAENGAVVPVEIVSNIPNTISLAVVVDKNPFPLTTATTCPAEAAAGPGDVRGTSRTPGPRPGSSVPPARRPSSGPRSLPPHPLRAILVSSSP